MSVSPGLLWRRCVCEVTPPSRCSSQQESEELDVRVIQQKALCCSSSLSAVKTVSLLNITMALSCFMRAFQ